MLCPLLTPLLKDWQINVCELTIMHYLTFGTVYAILTNDQGQVKKSAH
jgi:hypothetical protein